MLGSCEKSSSRRLVGSLVALALTAVTCAGCFCPWGPVICDSWPIAETFVDADCDGLRGDDEEPLPGVCVWSPTLPRETPPYAEYCAEGSGRTNEEGVWYDGPISGCATEYYIVALTPAGYEPTSDTIVGDSMYAEFGFAPEGTCPQRSIVTAADLAAERRARLRRNTNLIGAVVFGGPALIGLILVGVKLHARRQGREGV
jgi:hypothetical protein